MTLSTIARSMRTMIDQAQSGWVRRDLPRGLSVILSHKGPAYRLALAREDVYPSEQEIAICASTYNVPEGTEPFRFRGTTYHPKTGRKMTIYVVELKWQDLDASPPIP